MSKQELIDKLTKVWGSSTTEEQIEVARRYTELTEKALTQIEYCDPSKFIDFIEKRTTGCFACQHSTREKIDGKMRSICRPLKDGIIHFNKRGDPLDYPCEGQKSCDSFVKRVKKWSES